MTMKSAHRNCETLDAISQPKRPRRTASVTGLIGEEQGAQQWGKTGQPLFAVCRWFVAQ